MDYMLHYTNGSSGYLAHFGVKGMKWGVWNEETKARRSGKDSKIEKADRKANEAYQKLQGAANRKLNREGFLSNWQVTNAANKYVKAKGKAALARKKAGVPDDPYGIRRREREAYEYQKGLSVSSALAGPIGAGIYSANSKKRSSYEWMIHRSIRDTEEQAGYGKQQISELLEKAKQGKVVGAHFDGHGNSYYMTKK